MWSCFSSGCDTDESLKSAFLLVKDSLHCPGNRLFVGNISFRATPDMIRSEFATFGEVSVHLPMDRKTGRYAQVCLPSRWQLTRLPNHDRGMNNLRSIEGRPLVVNEARPAPAGGVRRAVVRLMVSQSVVVAVAATAVVAAAVAMVATAVATAIVAVCNVKKSGSPAFCFWRGLCDVQRRSSLTRPQSSTTAGPHRSRARLRWRARLPNLPLSNAVSGRATAVVDLPLVARLSAWRRPAAHALVTEQGWPPAWSPLTAKVSAIAGVPSGARRESGNGLLDIAVAPGLRAESPVLSRSRQAVEGGARRRWSVRGSPMALTEVKLVFAQADIVARASLWLADCHCTRWFALCHHR